MEEEVVIGQKEQEQQEILLEPNNAEDTLLVDTAETLPVEITSAEPVLPPSKEMVSMRLNRAGRILANISIACGILCIALVVGLALSGLLAIFVFLLSFCIVIILTVFTLGTVYVWGKSIIDFFWGIVTNFGEFNFGKIAEIVLKTVPYLAYIGVASGILALGFIIASRKRAVVKIVLVSIFLVVSIAVIVLKILGRGMYA